MPAPELHQVTSAPLPYLLSLPAPDLAGVWPVLCFLHGYDEGAPMPITQALTRHGPLAPAAAPAAASSFVIVAPQLPVRGDLWHRHAGAVEAVVREVQARHGGDPTHTCLTGFSFGGNGVFDLAASQPSLWRALWAVDPTRVPEKDPGRPLWLSSGAIARHYEQAFLDRLHLATLHHDAPGDRVYLDQGLDHTETAAQAYGDERIYRWLLSR